MEPGSSDLFMGTEVVKMMSLCIGCLCAAFVNFKVFLVPLDVYYTCILLINQSNVYVVSLCVV